MSPRRVRLTCSSTKSGNIMASRTPCSRTEAPSSLPHSPSHSTKPWVSECPPPPLTTPSRMVKRNVPTRSWNSTCKRTYPPIPSDTLCLRVPPDMYLYLFYHFSFISLFILMFTLRSDPPSDPIVFMHSSSVSYSFIVRYLFILFPEPSTACPRVGTVYIQLLNTCYGFPQIISLWIPLTGQSPFL